MKRILLDYWILSSLRNPDTKVSELAKHAFFRCVHREQNIQAVCFDYQLQAINLSSLKKRYFNELDELRELNELRNNNAGRAGEDTGLKLLAERQSSVVERLKNKATKVSSLFSARFAEAITPSFLVPAAIVPVKETHFVDEKDVEKFNVEVVGIHKDQCRELLDSISGLRSADSSYTDFQLVDLLTYLSAGLLKIDGWFLKDRDDRVLKIQNMLMNNAVQEYVKDSEIKLPVLVPVY